MAKRSPSQTPPPAVLRAELDRELSSGTLADGGALTRWLGERGYRIAPRAANGAVGSQAAGDFEARLEAVRLATAQARAIVESSPADDPALSEALTRLVQANLFELLADSAASRTGRSRRKKLDLALLARIVSQLGRVAVAQQKWGVELRDRLAEKLKGAERQVTDLAREAGLSPETERKIRDALLGIQV